MSNEEWELARRYCRRWPRITVTICLIVVLLSVLLHVCLREDRRQYEAHSYIVFTDGTSYYAKNGSTGEIEYARTSASDLIQDAIGTGYRTLSFKAGTYNLDSTLIIKHNSTWLVGENIWSTIFQISSNNTDVISVEPTSGFVEDIRISGFTLDTPSASNGDGVHVQGKVYYSQFSELLITDAHYGLLFNSTSVTRGIRHDIRNIHVRNAGYAGIGMIEQDSHSLYKIDIQDSNYGVILESKTQGLAFDSLRIDNSTYTSLYIQDVQVLFATNVFISEAGTNAITITGGTSTLYFNNLYLEASSSDQVYICNDFGYSNYDITFSNSKIVRGGATGIKFVGTMGKNTSYVNIADSNIANNGQSANNTYAGIYAWNGTFNVRIENCFVGNFISEVGEYYQQGIQNSHDCDYWLIKGCDVSTAVDASPIQLMGVNDKCSLCWNGTNWIP